MKDRYGIAVAGTVLLDKLKGISAYPDCGELVQIKSMDKAVGGLVPNVGIDLKKIDPTLEVFAYGKVGCDEEGYCVGFRISHLCQVVGKIKTYHKGIHKLFLIFASLVE